MVLEGNRRLGALKALENPDSLADAVTPAVLKELRKLSKQYHEAPIDFVDCFVAKNRTFVVPAIQTQNYAESAGTSWKDLGRRRLGGRRNHIPSESG